VSCVCASTDLTDAAEIGVVTQVPDAHPKSPVPAFHRVDRVLGFFFSFSFLLARLNGLVAPLRGTIHVLIQVSRTDLKM
jgi:hypothetical protein